MSDADRENLETRVLVLAPTVKDGELTRAILARAGIACAGCADPGQVCEQLTAGAGAVLIAEEAIHGGDGRLAEWLGRQPPWSDLPVLVLARAGADSPAVARAMDRLGNVAIVERPARVAALVSAVRSALRARRRQYQLRDHLVERERFAEQLDMAMMAANAGSWRIDLTTGEFSASDRAIELHGLPPGSHPNHERALACVHSDDRASVEAALRRTFETGQSFRHEHRVPQPDGSVRWVVSHAERRGEGDRTCVIGLVQDITERKRAEAELRQSETRFRAAINTVSDIVWTNDAQGRMSGEQAAWGEFTGQDRESYQGHGWSRAIHPDDAQPTIDTWNVAVAEKQLFVFEHRVRRGDGQWRLCSIRAVPILDDGGEVREWVGVHTDITERKRAEDTLRQNAAMFSTLIAQAPMGTYVVDAQFRMKEVNAEARPAFASVQPLIGRDLGEVMEILWGAKVGGQIVDIFRHTLATGERYVSPPFTEQRHDVGIEQTYEWETQRIIFPDGQHGVVCYFHEVTERARATAALRASQERIRLAAETTGVGIWEWNVITNAIRWDASMFRIYGIEPTPDGFVQYQDWSGAVLPEELAENEAILQDTLRRCGRSERTFRIRRRDDRECRNVASVETVRMNAEGQVEWVVGTTLDITERTRAEDELRRLAAELSEADRRKDVFLATLAHELRNPLAPIRNGLQVIKLSGPNGKVEQARAMMDRQVTQMVRLVDDLLDISRVTSGKLILRKERIDLRAVIDAAVETSRPAIEQAGHELDVAVPDGPIFVDGDAARLAQVVSNLLNNSAKYTHRGGRIRLAVERASRAASAPGDEVEVSVKDDGIGIPPAMLGRVFEMFTQVDRTLEKTTGGLGIGLSLVKGLMEMHGGTIEAKSDGEGMGSEFVVRLPVAMPVVVGPDRLIGETNGVPPSAVRRILVVDDNVDAADSLGQLLEMLGNEVRTANDGEAGVGAAAQFRPDVVLMDIGMPKLNGYEAARRIRGHPWGAGMVLVALTGWGQDEDRKKTSDAGFNHHLVKPVETDALMKLLAGLTIATA